MYYVLHGTTGSPILCNYLLTWYVGEMPPLSLVMHNTVYISRDLSVTACLCVFFKLFSLFMGLYASHRQYLIYYGLWSKTNFLSHIYKRVDFCLKLALRMKVVFCKDLAIGRRKRDLTHAEKNVLDCWIQRIIFFKVGECNRNTFITQIKVFVKQEIMQKVFCFCR